MSRRKHERSVAAEAFLRSINIAYDAEAPDRIEHFRPTTKCVGLLRSLLGQDDDGAFFVVAPYGTGKSLTAAYFLHLVENRPESSKALLTIEKRLAQVSPDLGKFASTRRARNDRHGFVLALNGANPSLAESIRDAAIRAMSRLRLGRQLRTIEGMPAETTRDAIGILEELKAKGEAAGFDRISIVWDEFGRHVEGLLAEGRGSALHEIQVLAEYVSRRRGLPVTLALLLHQGLLHYAANMPQSIRGEWKKIEGRFRTIQYVDDSKELYRLVAEVAASRSTLARPSQAVVLHLAKKLRQLGLFGQFGVVELGELLKLAAPIEPVALFLLPRVSARVAQNERTLFSFLYDVDLAAPITPAALYDYFAHAMRSDTAVGGTHRQWLETESAISKAIDDRAAIAALKTACLLGLGTRGERSRTSRELLVTALGGFGRIEEPSRTVDALVERKLLLHRRHNDEVSVWHGTDIDLRGRLDDAKRRDCESFDLLAFLSKEVRPPAWKPVEYNDDFFIRRYLTGEYQSVRRLDAYVSFDLVLKDFPADVDGRVVYLIAESPAELAEAEAIAKSRVTHDRLILAVPREPLPLHDAALEVACLSKLQLDADLVNSDPLALAEIKQMSDDARDHLQRLVDRLIGPGPRGPRWFYRGEEIIAESPRELRSALSSVMREIYPMTPRINSETIVRKKPSPIMVNSRKKLVLGILERHGQDQLGIRGDFPDKAMFRAVLLRTGLYRADSSGRCAYAAPRAVKDPGLRAVWAKLHEFLTVPAAAPKEPAKLFAELELPPYGLRAGVIPILFAAALKAFPNAISLLRDGQYVTDILPSEIEQLCRQPESYRLQVPDLDASKLSYLRGLHKRFTRVRNHQVAENDLIRLCFDAIEGWKSQLPPAALTTKQLSERASAFRTAICRRADPTRMLFEDLPAALGQSLRKRRQLLGQLDRVMEELSSVATLYSAQAATSIRHAVSLGSHAADEPVRGLARRWSACFSGTFVESLHDGVAKGLLSRMQMPYSSDALLFDSLASLLVGKPLSRWDDSTSAVFDRELHGVVHRIEDAALSSSGSEAVGKEARRGLARLVEGRVAELMERLANVIGTDEAIAVYDSIRSSVGTQP